MAFEPLRSVEEAVRGLPPALSEDLTRWASRLGPEENASGFAVGSLDVLRAHYLVAERFLSLGNGLSQPGVKNIHLLQSAVSRQFVGYAGARKWKDPFEVAATLFYGLVKNHAFHDSNKRTALLVAFYQLLGNHRLANANEKAFELLTERVAEDALGRYEAFRKSSKNDDAEVIFIADFFRSKTRREDKREYRISYRQLDALLRRYNLFLADPHDNRIAVYRETIRKSGFFGKREQRVHEKLTTIGFKDWGTEVSGKDIRYVRRLAGLDAERGIDSKVFFQDVDQVEALIAQYSDMLKRLSKK